jgi:hypothetical protein
MDQYGRELDHEIRRGSKEGRYALRVAREYTRCEREDIHRQRYAEIEQRSGLTTGGGATASAAGGGVAPFVVPYFITEPEEIGYFNEAHRTFADQCGTYPMPAYGMEIYLGAFTSAAGAAQYTEGNPVTEVDPGMGLLGNQVTPIAGKSVMSRAVYDRTPGNGGFDIYMGRQLRHEYDKALTATSWARPSAKGPRLRGRPRSVSPTCTKISPSAEKSSRTRLAHVSDRRTC